MQPKIILRTFFHVAKYRKSTYEQQKEVNFGMFLLFVGMRGRRLRAMVSQVVTKVTLKVITSVESTKSVHNKATLLVRAKYVS